MNLNQIQSIASPFLAPVAPAVLLGSQLYQGMTLADVPPAVALIGAVASGVGMEMAGALAFSMALVSLRRKAWGPMWVAIACVIFYAVFAIAGIQTATNGATFAAFVGVSLVAFGASGTRQYLTDMQAGETSRAQVLDAETRNLKARASLVKVEAKASSMSAPSADKPDTSADNGQGELEKRVIEYYASNPSATVREAADALGCGKSSVAKYRPHGAEAL